MKILSFLCLLLPLCAWEEVVSWIQPEPGQHVWSGAEYSRAAGWKVYVQRPEGPELVLDLPNTLGQPAAVTLQLPDGPQTVTVVAYSATGLEATDGAYTIHPAKAQTYENGQWKTFAFRRHQTKDIIRLIPPDHED